MIKQDFNRKKYIGGSDAKYLYMNYNTKTFRNWFFYKTTGIRSEWENRDFMIGNFFEEDILDTMEISKEHRNIYLKYSDVIGCNTDAFNGNEIIEVKTCQHNILNKWLIGSFDLSYKRQLLHSCICGNINNATLYALPLTFEEKNNPFDVIITKEKIHTFSFEFSDEEKNKHINKCEYMEWCILNNEMPINNFENL